MDIVIPFVDCTEKVWMKNLLSYNIYCPLHQITKPTKWFSKTNMYMNYTYWYNYGSLKYVLRGIDKYIPYVDNVFLLVSNIEQVPEYVDQSKVKVILHKDFIPENLLPTFSSKIIELFFDNIPGLNEEFIYIPDDMIPISSINYNEFFNNGLPCYSIQEPGPKPMLKSEYSKVSKKLIKTINPVYSKFRNNKINLFNNLLYMCKHNMSESYTKYTTILDIDNIDLFEIQKNYKFICINDTKSIYHPLSYIEQSINKKLSSILSEKCKYENDR